MWFRDAIEVVFSLALFINAMLFVPQLYRILQKKSGKDISLITFVGFWLTQLITVAHGIIHHDLILIFGYIAAMITCGAVIIAALIYRGR